MSQIDAKILIVDDDKDILETLKMILASSFTYIETLSNPNLLLDAIRKVDYDIVLLDMIFRAGIQTGNEGIFWLREILKKKKDIQVVLITAYGDVKLAVKAIKEGAADFILKPWENEKLIASLQTVVKLKKSNDKVQRMEVKQRQDDEDYQRKKSFIVGRSEMMLKVLETVSKVARTDANILITGESGTGKEVWAREIHRRSGRSKSGFVAVDLVSISENLFESELFGHVKGAYTGANQDRIGRFETASDGTLFIDEIGILPLALQAKLLSALQTNSVIPVGSNSSVDLDFRLISATNRSLHKMVSENTFRQDLLYRLNTVEIELPPLRDRGEDIALLAQHFLNKYSTKYEKEGLVFDQSAIVSMMEYQWPGNIRELEHTIENVVILTDSKVITQSAFNFKNNPEDIVAPDLRTLDDIEKFYLARAMQKHKGNLSEVARELNIGRPTVYRKIKKYDL